jgi:hypothetical protein
VEEKETGARDLMLCQNLQSWVLAAAWAATYGVILAIVCAAVTIVCCTSFLRFTEPTLLLVRHLCVCDEHDLAICVLQSFCRVNLLNSAVYIVSQSVAFWRRCC